MYSRCQQICPLSIGLLLSKWTYFNNKIGPSWTLHLNMPLYFTGHYRILIIEILWSIFNAVCSDRNRDQSFRTKRYHSGKLSSNIIDHEILFLTDDDFLRFKQIKTIVSCRLSVELEGCWNLNAEVHIKSDPQ